MISSRQAYAIAAACGLLVFFVVYGPGHLFGTSTYWDLPQDDSRAYLMGYRYFLVEPWHWPIFDCHRIDAPGVKSFALSDGIPIWALVNKLVATVIPPWRAVSARAYLGMWHALSYALQACLGVAIVRQLGHRTRGSALVAIAFFLAVPSWIERYMHAALSAHFLILWAILLYLRTPVRSEPSRRLQLAWLGELAIATLTNPYHAAISFGFFVASLVRSRCARALIWLPPALACIGVLTWSAGYFTHAATAATGGFDVYSSNVLTFVAPQRSGIVGDLFGWYAPGSVTANQYEGSAYLGLGVLILLALVVRSPIRIMRRHPAVSALAIACWLLALSNHIYCTDHLIAAYDVPAPLRVVRDLFRAPGRFAWVPMYALIILALHHGLGRFTTGWRRLVVPALAVVQIADASGDWRYQHSYTQAPYSHYLPIEPWRALVRAHDAVVELPSYDCVGWNPPHAPQISLELEYYASERTLPINGVYGARPTHDCRRDARELPTIEPQPGTLYVILPSMFRLAYRFAAFGATCVTFDYGRACSFDRAALATIGTPAPVSTPTLAYGASATSTTGYLADGWSWAEPGGRWSDGPIASLRFHLDGEPPPHPHLVLQARAPLCRRRYAEDVLVRLNGHSIALLHFDATSNADTTARTIAIPDPAWLRGPALALDFIPLDTRSPQALHCNGDSRELGLWLRDLRFE
jgi:hypothetical protein